MRTTITLDPLALGFLIVIGVLAVAAQTTSPVLHLGSQAQESAAELSVLR